MVLTVSIPRSGLKHSPHSHFQEREHTVTMTERNPISIQQAMEANSSFFGFDLLDEIEYEREDGVTEKVSIVYRELLDKDTRDRVNDVYKRYNECDRQKVEIVDENGKTNTIEGAYKDPRQKDGIIFDLDEELCIALWGKDKYERFVAAGGPPGMVQMTWTRMDRQIAKRAASDSKSR
jgi:hypothetical protein